ncbi:MAG TPA: ABC transporter permease [Acidimicrobiia bacterium]|nr:ABC transporter permease [Acidimicrobiia bacterium]
MGSIAGVVVRRALSGVLTIFLLVTFVFFMMRVVGDPVASLAPEDATQEQIDALRVRLGLDGPLIVQYRDYLLGILEGDLGRSYRSNRPAVALVLERLPATLELAAVALGLAVLVAIPVGVIAAVRPGSLIDAFSRVFAVLGQSLPVFWLAILLIIVFAVNLGWFPSTGRGGIEHLVLPGLALSVYSIPLTMRLTRSALMEELGKDYIRTGRAKGLREWEVVAKHGLRNSMIPVITVLALRVGTVITGAIILEEVFAYPGLGRLGVQALQTADFPVIQAFIVFIAAVTVSINLIVDILYTVVDPRVRLT